MGDTIIKFAGGECQAAQCGSKNPIAAMMATLLLQEMNQFGVAQAQEAQLQSVGVALNAGGVSRA